MTRRAFQAGTLLLLIGCGLDADSAVHRTTETIPMRDGVRLAADIYSLSLAEKRPVLLQRTPYNKAGAAVVAEKYALAGYTVVVQDTRGRFASEGAFFPYNNEGQDGYDTLDWIAKQPWSNGKVGMWGASYVGAVQYQAVAEGAPGLAVLCPTATWSSFYRNIYLGGAARLALIATAAASLYPPPAGTAPPSDWYGALLSTPLVDMDRTIGWQIPWLSGILAHNRPDGFWKRLDLTSEVEQLTSLPAQHVVGYYDFFLRETVANFQRLRKRSDNQQLILGPWDHGSIGKQKLGDVDFGPESQFDLAKENLSWFDRFLQKSAGSFPKVRYFSMGDNVWRSAQGWPPENASPVSLYLSSGGHANTRHGDGKIATKGPAGSQAEDTFVADPADPTPALPAGYLRPKLNAFWGPVDQTSIEDRKDVLVYDSGPLSTEMKIAGPVEAELWVSANTPDSDWVVKFVHVTPGGLSYNIATGIQRSSFAEKPLQPNRTGMIRVDVGHVAASIAAGHSLRVEVSGAYFPLFERNLNTAEGPSGKKTLASTQKVYHAPRTASRVLLHVIR